MRRYGAPRAITELWRTRTTRTPSASALPASVSQSTHSRARNDSPGGVSSLAGPSSRPS